MRAVRHASVLNDRLVAKLALTVLAAAALLVAGASKGGARGTEADGRIAFQSDRDGGFEIYVMNADGRDQTRLTNNSTEDRTPVWSPDGRRLAFISNRQGSFDIYVMNANGGEQTRAYEDARR